MRIVFIPVDERFCTRNYFLLLAEAFNLDVVTPPIEMLGRKKIPADIDAIWHWLETEIKDDDILILSLDMILYGGLIPSRMSVDSTETIRNRLNKLKNIKHPSNKIYLSATVTRIPAYNYADEEPDYWDYFGVKIHEYSKKRAQFERGFLSTENLEMAEASIPTWILRDFLWRRRRNFNILRLTIELLSEKIIDFLNLVLDDNAPNSLSVFEAERHADYAKELGLVDRISIHPGADESLLTLLARAMVEHVDYHPKIRIFYSQPEFVDLIPPYEGTPVKESVPIHLETCGATVVPNNEDGLLIVHNPNDRRESEQQVQANESVYQRIVEVLTRRKISGICDIAFANGADNKLVENILNPRYDWSKILYAAWNTAGNTTGTVCCALVLRILAEKGFITLNLDKLYELNAIFLLEHWGYQANVRKLLRDIEAPKRGGDLFTVIPLEGWAKKYVKEKLNPFRDRIERVFGRNYDYLEPFFPWHRPFEIGFLRNSEEDISGGRK